MVETIKPPKKAPAQEAQGVTWVASTGISWQETGTTVTKLKKFAENVYGDGITEGQQTLIFTGPPVITVLDDKGQDNPDRAQWLTAMSREPTISLYYRMQQSWYGTFWYGPGLFTLGKTDVGNERRLSEIRYLPPDSFSLMPGGNVTYRAYCSLLPGIALTTDNEVEYWQVQSETDTTPVRIDDIFDVHNPIRPELGSRPTILSIVPVLAMLDYLWNSQMQKCHRTGAPLLFIRITGARDSTQLKGKPADAEYAKTVLKNWGKNTGYALRENMELVDPHITDNADNLETIAVLTKLINDHFSPASMISSDGQNTIGGSAQPQLDLLAARTRATQSWLCEAWARPLQQVLDENGFEGYTVSLKLPDLQFDTSARDRLNTDVGMKHNLLLPNEGRALLKQPALDAEGLVALAEYNASKPKAAVNPTAFGNVSHKLTEKKVVNTVDEDIGAAIEKARMRVFEALAQEGL